jgi:hypothetical protein
MEFLSKDSLETYHLKKGDTLAAIANRHTIKPEELAYANWGSSDDTIVCRALFEVVGSKRYPDKWRHHRFDGDEGEARGTGTILVPEEWITADGVIDEVQEIEIYRPRPARAVSIDKLDKWFVPGPIEEGGEPCCLSISLEGDDEKETKLAVEIYGSHYGGPSAQQAAPSALYRKTWANLPPQSTHNATWDGQAFVDDGLLKQVGDNPRFVNVAFSPYTLLSRHYEDDADAEALLSLSDFWPAWAETKNERRLDTASLRIRWMVSHCDKLAHGQLRIVDKTDTVVFRRALKKDGLNNGDHTFQWDGILDDGTEIRESQTPYRVQIQAHSGQAEEMGIAMAAMHTEVRLFVASELGSGRPGIENSMEISLAPLTEGPPERSETIRWGQYRLALAGYPVGPINGELRSRTRAALREFQRSVPANDKPAYERLKITGVFDDETCDALARTPAESRPNFGDPKTRDSISRERASDLIGDSREQLIVWIDDRNYFTHTWRWLIDRSQPHLLDNYRPHFDAGDKRLGDYNEESILRPWLELWTQPLIRSRDTKNEGLRSKRCAKPNVGRKVMGPLRVNWFVEDLEPDNDVIKKDHPNHGPAVRSHPWVKTMLKALSDDDETRPAYNCPQDFGGLRKTTPDGKTHWSYFSDTCFASGPDAKQTANPYAKLTNNPHLGNVSSVLHHKPADHRDGFFPSRIGRSTAYFQPSIIAGDGYRVGAELSFDDTHTDEKDRFGNESALSRRYPNPPRTLSAGLRLWKRAAYRGQVAWTEKANQKQNPLQAARLYRGAFMHFVGPVDDSVPLFNASDVIDQEMYRDVVDRFLLDRHYRKLPPVLNHKYLWPFLEAPAYGIPPSEAGIGLADAWEEVLKPARDAVIDPLLEPLALAITHRLERKYGHFRGNTVGFVSYIPSVVLEQIHCNQRRCGTTMVEVINNTKADDRAVGNDCPISDCKGKMVRYLLPKKAYYESIGGYSIAQASGWTWCIAGKAPVLTAHEVGHTRHLEHSPSWPSKLIEEPGGASACQHDHVRNPAFPRKVAKNAGWDRKCIMSYARGRLFFCGPCLLKLRGWKIERISNVIDGDGHRLVV